MTARRHLLPAQSRSGQCGGNRLAVVLRVANAGAGAHHLHVARLGASLMAEAVLMRDRALPHIGDDLHVGVGMRREAGVGRDLVVVPYPQGSVPHAIGL